jgi:hypothetical protein
MQELKTNQLTVTIPHLAIETDENAIAAVNRWLHREVGMALNASEATFNLESFCWHVPIHLAYGETGSLGIVGDVYLHAATGEFIGILSADELQKRADALAKAHGVTE